MVASLDILILVEKKSERKTMFQEFKDLSQILSTWYWERCTGGMTTDSFLTRLKKWELAGFISSHVWSRMANIVDSETISAAINALIKDEFKKLYEDAEITDRVLSCVSRYIVTSRRMQFALEILTVGMHQFGAANANSMENEGRLNFQVCT